MRIYIDMDHTFCDFDGALPYWRERAVTKTEKNWPWSMRGFFESLLPMEGSIEFWNNYIDKMDLWFLTKPSIPNRQCYTEKANWVYKYLGEKGVEKLIICPRKELLIGDILIDDHHNAGQPEFNGMWWQFGKPGFENWDVIDKRLESLFKFMW